MTSQSPSIVEALLAERTRHVRNAAERVADDITESADLLFTFSFYLADSHEQIQAGTTPRICTAVVPLNQPSGLLVMVPPQNAGVQSLFKQATRDLLRAALTVQLYQFDEPTVHMFESTGRPVPKEDDSKFRSFMSFLDTTTRTHTDTNERLMPKQLFRVTLRFDAESGCDFKTATFQWNNDDHEPLVALLTKEARIAHTADMLGVAAKLARTLDDEDWTDE